VDHDDDDGDGPDLGDDGDVEASPYTKEEMWSRWRQFPHSSGLWSGRI
jgi:hypothetical protein